MLTRIAFAVVLGLCVFSCGEPIQIGDEAPPPNGDEKSPPPAEPAGDTPWSNVATLSLDVKSDFTTMARTETRAVFGAYNEGSPLGGRVGAAYIFERQGDRWVRGQRLQASKQAAYAAFGSVLAVHDDLIVVHGGSAAVGYDGFVYVFGLRDGFWTELSTIASPFQKPLGWGSGLVLTADTLAVGSEAGLSLYARTGEKFQYLRTIPAEGSDGVVVAGSDKVIVLNRYRGGAYAILSKDGAWSDPIALPIAPRFAESVAVDGTRVAVGHPGSGPPMEPVTTPGKVTVYELASGAPVEIASVTGPSDRPNFGWPLAIRGDRLVTDSSVLLESKGWAEEPLIVTGPSLGPDFDVRRGGSGFGARAIALGADDAFYQMDDGAVVRAKFGEPDREAQTRALQRITTDEATSNPGVDRWGKRVSVGGGVAVVEGSLYSRMPVSFLPGSWMNVAYLFERRSGTWQFKQSISGVEGCTVNADGASIACRAPSSGIHTGVQIFERGSDGLWRGVRTVSDAETMHVNIFAFDGDRLAMGIFDEAGFNDDSADRETLVIYERIAGTWSLRHRAVLDADDHIYTVAVGRSLVAVGIRPDGHRTEPDGSRRSPSVHAFGRNAAGEWADAGTVYVGDWRHGQESSEGATQLAVSEDRVVLVRSQYTRTPYDIKTTLDEYTRSDASWVLTARAPLPLPRPGGFEGLAHFGEDWLAGAPGDATGSVTLLNRTATGFVITDKWTDPQGFGEAQFGHSLGATATTRVVGEPGHNRVRIFERAAKPLR